MTHRCAFAALSIVTVFSMTALAEEAATGMESNDEQPDQPADEAGATDTSEEGDEAEPEDSESPAGEGEEQVGEIEQPSVEADDEEMPSEDQVAPEEPDEMEREDPMRRRTLRNVGSCSDPRCSR